MMHFHWLLKQEETFYKQKARADWIKLDDANTKFFHNSVKMRNLKNKILCLKMDNSHVVTNQEAIRTTMVDFYVILIGSYNHERIPIDPIVLEMGNKVNKEEAKMLCG